MDADSSKTEHWSGTGKLRGGKSGISFFITALRVLGLRVTYVLSIPVAIYFSYASPDVAATMDFHRRVFGRVPWWKKRWLVFKHFFSFGRAIIDRTAILAGQTHKFSYSFDGEHHVHKALAEGRGVLLLTAHLGNWEAAGQLLTRLDVIINVTGFDNESDEIRALLNRSSKAKFRLLPLTGSPTDAIPLVGALRRGEIVAMLGDRDYGSPSSRANFLGESAAFPIGAYVLASIANAPLVTVFNLRESGGHYRFFGFPAQYPKMPAHHLRDAYLKNCAATFAQNLEMILKRDPMQWYNFYPFWNQRANTQFREKLEAKLALTEKPVALRIKMSNAIESLIPHRAPMRFIDALTDCTETTATATACFGADHFAVTDGLVLEAALVECVAQTVAAAQGQRGKNSSQPGGAANGMLAAVSKFQIHLRPAFGKILKIEVRELKRLGPMLLIAGEISCDGEMIAEGELSLYAA